MRFLQLIGLCLIGAGLAAAQNSALMPWPIVELRDSNGKPYAGACLYSYAAGSSTPQATYTDSTLNTSNTNPLALDAAGRAHAWIAAAAYKFILTAKPIGIAACPATAGTPIWTVDNVTNAGQLLRLDLSSTGTGKGAALVGYVGPESGSAPETVKTAIDALRVAGSTSPMPFGAKGDCVANDQAAVQAAIDTGKPVVFPPGCYLVGNGSSALSMADHANQSLTAPLGATLRFSGISAGVNAIDMSGCNNCAISGFTIDAPGFTDPGSTLIYGDGTVANGSYGNIRIRSLTVNDWPGTCLGIGANAGKTVHDIWYEHNTLTNCGTGGTTGNTGIDTGSAGTKHRFHILSNDLIFTAAPATPTYPAIFAGHGSNYDFEISGNHIVGGPWDGIQIYNRPFGTEATTLTNFSVDRNSVRLAGGVGITLYGGTGVGVRDNMILNAHYDGIVITTGTTGASTITAPQNLAITGNVIVDDRAGSATMSYAIVDASPVAHPATGVMSGNYMAGMTSGAYMGYPNQDAHNRTSVWRQQDWSDTLNTSLDTGASDTYVSWLLAKQLRFKQAAGQDANSGIIDAGTLDAGFLDINGVGATAGTRKIALWDKVYLGTAQSTPISRTLSGSSTLGWTSIAAGACQISNVTVTGTAGTDVAYASPVGYLGSVNLSWSAQAIADGVAVTVCNPTIGAITPDSVAWKAAVIRFN